MFAWKYHSPHYFHIPSTNTKVSHEKGWHGTHTSSTKNQKIHRFQYCRTLSSLFREILLGLSNAREISLLCFLISLSKMSSPVLSSTFPMSHSTDGSGVLMKPAAVATLGTGWLCRDWISHSELLMALDFRGSRSSIMYGSADVIVSVGWFNMHFNPGCLKNKWSIKDRLKLWFWPKMLVPCELPGLFKSSIRSEIRVSKF